MKNVMRKLCKSKGRIKRSVLNLAVSSVFLFIVSCGDDEPDKTDNETNNFGISSISELGEKSAEILSIANGSNEVVNVYITSNIGVSAEEKVILKNLGEFKRRANIHVDWSRNPDVDTNTLRSTADNFGVYPIGIVTLNSNEYKNVFGGGFTLLANPETNETIIVPENEQYEFEESGSHVAILDSSKDWVVNSADEMYSLFSLIPDGKDSDKQITFVFNEILSDGTREARTAQSVLSSSTGEIRGLTASSKSHIEMLRTLATTENVTITNSNVKAGEHGLEIDADFAIDHYNIVNDGKYNNNRLFRVNGANGARRLTEKYDAGVYFATDTASYGAEAKALDNFVMDRMTVDIDGAPASGLTKLGDWRGSTIKVKQAKIEGGHGVAALYGHTNATFRTFSMSAAPNSGAPFYYDGIPAIGPWVDPYGVPPTGVMEGSLALDTIYVGCGDYTYEKMMNSVWAEYAIKPGTIPVVYEEGDIYFSILTTVGSRLSGLKEVFVPDVNFTLDVDSTKIHNVLIDDKAYEFMGGTDKAMVDILKDRYTVLNADKIKIKVYNENQH